MSGNEHDLPPLPTRLARRRLLVGRLVIGVLCSNFVFALILAFILSGPAASYTRFQFGIVGWTAALFAASLVLAVPVVGGLVVKLLRPPVE